MASTAVVILNWNGVEQLRTFLPSVVMHTTDADIIIADNASTDESVSWIKEHYPTVGIIELPVNYGYAGGYNEALKQLTFDYFILLNSDVEVTPGWNLPLTALLDSDSSIAACQPTIRSYKQKEYFEYAGAAGGFIDKYGIPFCRGRVLNILEKDSGQYNTPLELFWATGACLVIRSEVFHRAGGFDTDFFAHMEEIDLCWTIHRMGYRILHCPGSLVYHVGAATLQKENPKKTFLNFRNSLWMLYKHLPSDTLIPVLFLRMVQDGLAALHYLSRGKAGLFYAVFSAHIHFYMHGSKRTKRKQYAGYPYYYSGQRTILHSSLIIAFYLKGKKYFSALLQG